MNKYSALFRGDMYTAFIAPNMYSGYDVSIYKARQGRAMKYIYSQHSRSFSEARTLLDDYLDGTKWSEKK